MTEETAVRVIVAHQVPGRLRLQVEKGADATAAARRIAEALGGTPGFAGAEARPASRSVVVRYDPAFLDSQRLLAPGALGSAIEVVGSAGEPTGAAGGTRVGQTVVGAVSSVNSGIERATRGFLDLRDIFPLTLFGFGLRRVAQGNLQPMPWYNLLYYGYSTFYSLHNRRGSATPEPDATEILRRRYARGELSDDEYQRMLGVLGLPPGEASES